MYLHPMAEFFGAVSSLEHLGQGFPCPSRSAVLVVVAFAFSE